MSAAEGVNVNLECGARHESGHIVIAASQGLRFKVEGLMVDPSGWGLACYHDAPDENDPSRERNITAVLAGFAVEMRFRNEHSYAARDYLDVTFNDDNVKARRLLGRLAGNYALNESRLKNRVERLIEQHWLPIEMLASALLAKDWEPLKPLKSGGRWSQENERTAKYVTGDEAARILKHHGIAAVCDPNH
jgi:hypothetical protein